MTFAIVALTVLLFAAFGLLGVAAVDKSGSARTDALLLISFLVISLALLGLAVLTLGPIIAGAAS